MIRSRIVLAVALLIHPFVTGMLNAQTPIVIAHRGASGHRPEHTLEAYRLAIEMGADFIEPDLVSTRDGVLVCRHENEIGGTTDVPDHPEFIDRRTTKEIGGVPVTGWFTEDFTLAELKTLRARERLPEVRPHAAHYDGHFQIPTLDEVIALVQAESAARGRTIGIYPETKHPTYFRGIGLPLEEPLLAALERAGWTDAASPVFIQSFETENLRMLRGRTGVRLVQLMEATGQPYDFARRGDRRQYRDMATPAGLAEIATYADAIGPNKALVIPRTADGRLAPPSSLVADAHAAGLQVHPWTFRPENVFLPVDLQAGDRTAADYNAQKGDALAELAAFLATGIDGLFADYPDIALRARDAMRAGAPASRHER